MRSAYRQMLWVYLHQPCRSLVMGTLFVIGLIPLIVIAWIRPRFESALPQLTTSLVFLNLTVWIIFYQQIIGPRLRVWPGFVGPQLVSFIVASSVILLSFILSLGRCHDASSVGITSLILSFFTLMGLAILLESLLFAIALISGFAWLLYGSGGVALKEVFVGEMPNVSVALIVGALILLSLVLWRFFNLNEESRGYRTHMGFDDASVKPRMTGDGNRAWAKMRETGVMAYFRNIEMQPPITRDSPWGRIQRWRYQSSWKLVLMGAAIAGGMLFVPLIVFHHKADSFQGVFPDQTLLMLASIVSLTWYQRWKYIEAESLVPIGRDILFKELGLAMMLDYAIVLAISLLMLLFLARGESADIFQIALDVLLRVVGVILCFGFNAWALRYRSQGIGMFTMLIILPFAMLPYFFNGPLYNPAYVPWTLTGMFAAAFIGAALALRGYRLWLVTELG